MIMLLIEDKIIRNRLFNSLYGTIIHLCPPNDKIKVFYNYVKSVAFADKKNIHVPGLLHEQIKNLLIFD